jgi:hypothetical protein
MTRITIAQQALSVPVQPANGPNPWEIILPSIITIPSLLTSTVRNLRLLTTFSVTATLAPGRIRPSAEFQNPNQYTIGRWNFQSGGFSIDSGRINYEKYLYQLESPTLYDTSSSSSGFPDYTIDSVGIPKLLDQLFFRLSGTSNTDITGGVGARAGQVSPTGQILLAPEVISGPGNLTNHNAAFVQLPDFLTFRPSSAGSIGGVKPAVDLISSTAGIPDRISGVLWPGWSATLLAEIVAISL